MKAKPVQLASLFAMLFLALWGCEREASEPKCIPEGYYSGCFIYAGDTLFNAVSFHPDRSFSEQASGGAMYQKFPCLVEGSYVIENDYIAFRVEKYPDEEVSCSTELLLMGTFHLHMSGDTLDLTKGDAGSFQRYRLVRVSETL